jgi:hypothetical protein
MLFQGHRTRNCSRRRRSGASPQGFTARYVKVVTSGRTPAALSRYKAQNFEARPPLVCQRCAVI